MPSMAAAIEIAVATIRVNANIGLPNILDNSCRIRFLFKRHRLFGRAEQQHSARP